MCRPGSLVFDRLLFPPSPDMGERRGAVRAFGLADARPAVDGGRRSFVRRSR